MNQALKNVIEMSTGSSVNKALDDIYASLHGEVSDSEWADVIREDLLKSVDWNVPENLHQMAVQIQRSEKKKYVKSLPGSGAQLSFGDISPEFAEQAGVALDGGMFVKFIDAKPEHVFHYMKQRQKHASEVVDSVMRATTFYEWVSKHGSVKEAMRAKGVEGW